MTRNRILALAAVAVVLAALGLWRWQASRARPKSNADTVAVDRGRIVAKVTATGTLSAIVTVQVGSQVSGRVAALFADFNSAVKKGQLIAKIDPDLFQAATEQARANLAAAQGNLAKAVAQQVDAQRQAARARLLVDQKLIAQADYDTAQSNADAAAAQVKASEGAVEQARAALHQASVNLAYTDIRSPTSGTVISRNVDVGQTVAASLQAPTLFVIAEDLAKMQVDTSVAEADVGRLSSGMTASFTVDAYPSESFGGKVRQIRNSPQTVQNVVTYDAVIDVDNPDLKLKPGMTANCTFVYAEKDDVLRIPNTALRFRPPAYMLAAAEKAAAERAAAAKADGDRAGDKPAAGAQPRPGGGAVRAGAGPGRPAGADARTVWVMRDSAPVPLRIRVGISDGAQSEVVEGELKPGDQVVTDAAAGPSNFAAGLRRGL
jgi:HlyD family secretion protein